MHFYFILLYLLINCVLRYISILLTSSLRHTFALACYVLYYVYVFLCLTLRHDYDRRKHVRLVLCHQLTFCLRLRSFSLASNSISLSALHTLVLPTSIPFTHASSVKFPTLFLATHVYSAITPLIKSHFIIINIIYYHKYYIIVLFIGVCIFRSFSAKKC